MTTPEPVRVRVLRGGSWFFGARFVRCAHRDASVPGLRYANVGFRPVARIKSKGKKP